MARIMPTLLLRDISRGRKRMYGAGQPSRAASAQQQAARLRAPKDK
jgi:hypothetical protein